MTTPSTPVTDDVAKLKSENSDLRAQLAKAQNLASMTDAERAFGKRLSGDERDAFFAKDAAGRKATMDADEVVYTAADGSVFRKSDDQRMVAAVKRADEADKRAVEADKLAKRATFAKAAGELFSNVAGDLDTQILVLEAIDGLPVVKDAKPEEQPKAKALAMLKGANAAAAMVHKRAGTSTPPVGGSGGEDPESKLDALAKKHAEENKVSFAKAYDTVIQTPEGKALYQQSQDNRPGN